jgi:hypothetical protein
MKGSNLTSSDNAEISVDNIDREQEISQFFTTEKPEVENLAPLCIRQSIISVQQEVTIRQVAPLVLVLTGATFLHVGMPRFLVDPGADAS